MRTKDHGLILSLVATLASFPLSGETNVAKDPAIASRSFAGDWKDEDAPRPPLEKPGWTLTFNDDFDGVHLKDRNWYQSYRAGRKNWFRRMGIVSRFDDPDANYVIEDGVLKLRIDRDVPLRAEPKAAAPRPEKAEEVYLNRSFLYMISASWGSAPLFIGVYR